MLKNSTRQVRNGRELESLDWCNCTNVLAAKQSEYLRSSNCVQTPVLEFLNNLWRLGTEQEQGSRTGPPGYTAWRNWFLGIDSKAPQKFKNSGSVQGAAQNHTLLPVASKYIYGRTYIYVYKIKYKFFIFLQVVRTNAEVYSVLLTYLNLLIHLYYVTLVYVAHPFISSISK